jgi:uncharacterized protein (DUF2235 family)
MPRNLVVCLDGTAGQVRGPGDSNSVLAYQLLDLSDREKQVAFYDPGVGTFSAPGAWTPFARWFTRLGGLVYGGGLRENLGDAYLWLMQEWKPGDRVYIFGFSRGAFTARALVGMLRLVGLMRHGSENQLQYAVAEYARRGGEQKIPWDEIHRFSALFAQQVDGHSTVPITYLGVWDTVKAMGVARLAPEWPYTRKLPNAARIRHAVSIDEWRRPFREYLVDPAHPNLEEVWFAGIHSDVGGTFPDDPKLSAITLRWILEGAREEGILLTDAADQRFAEITSDNALGAAHRDNPVWSLLVKRPRPIPANARIHASVRERIASVPGYHPMIPVSATWYDEGWATPKAAAPTPTPVPVEQPAPAVP